MSEHKPKNRLGFVLAKGRRVTESSLVSLEDPADYREFLSPEVRARLAERERARASLVDALPMDIDAVRERVEFCDRTGLCVSTAQLERDRERLREVENG